MGRNASNLKPLAPLEDTQPTVLHPFRSQAETTENTSPTAVTAPGAPMELWGVNAGGSVPPWALEPCSCCPRLSWVGQGCFYTDTQTPCSAGDEICGENCFFHQALRVVCFSLTRGLDRSLLSSSEFHTCTLLFWFGFCYFFFLLF